MVQLINYVNSVGLKSYQDFLKNELSQLQNLRLKRQDEKQEVAGGQEKLQQSLDAIVSDTLESYFVIVPYCHNPLQVIYSSNRSPFPTKLKNLSRNKKNNEEK